MSYRYETRLRSKRRQHPLSLDQRQRIIEMYTQDHISGTEIFSRMKSTHEKVTLRTIQRLIQQYTKTGRVEAKRKGGCHPNQRISSAVEQKIVELVKNDNELTAYTLQFELDKAFESDPTYHTPALSSIYKVFHRTNLSLTVMVTRPDGWNSDSTKQKRWCYVHDVAQPLFTPHNTIFIDETPFASHHHRTHGWSPIGTVAKRTSSTIRGTNHSVIAAISPVHGLVYWKFKRTEESEEYETKGVGAEVFKNFVKELLQQPLMKNRSLFFFCVLDNVGFHKNTSVQTLINRHHQYQNLPPYSPFLNPLEYVFSSWKSKFNRLKHRNDEEVVEAITKSAEELSTELATFLRCYEHTKKYYPRVLNFEDIE
jgi:transposase